MSAPSKSPIVVRVYDAETDKLLEERRIENDYILICAGNRYVKSQQVMGKTHMLAVAVDSKGGAA